LDENRNAANERRSLWRSQNSAFKQVKSNGGSAGVDGIKTTGLLVYYGVFHNHAQK
jgi:hypothetical protein